MRKALASALLLLFVAASARGEIIRSFDVDLSLKPDSTLDVYETITVDFGDLQKHGIYRFIPVRYDRWGGSYTVEIRVKEVTDADGRAIKYKTARLGRDLNIRIGDPDSTVTGTNTYKIHYTARRAVNFFNDAPEVYWNATGNESKFPIERATLHFHPPEGIPIDDLKTAAFAGSYGSKNPARISKNKGGVESGGTIDFFAENLSPGDGLTIVVGLPVGATSKPSFIQELIWFIGDWWPLGVFPLATLGFIYWRWRTAGRDEGAGAAIPAEWNPPANLSPAEVGTLIDERCDMSDVTSTLVDLAARGYFKIEEVESDKFLFFAGKDYKFSRAETDPPNDELKLHEQMFLGAMFDWKGKVRYLSALKGTFYPSLSGIKSSIYSSLMNRSFFAANPEGVRQSYNGIGLLMLIGGIVLAIFGAQSGYIAYGLGLAISGAITMAWAPAMPAKTLAGTKAMRECLGFQRFLSMVEKDRIEKMADNDPTIFGRLLPYAMVLGCADRWAEVFKDILKEPPDWYTPLGGRGQPFSTIYFWSMFDRGMTTMSRTIATRPQPTPSSDRGGFFSSGGGGGSSGFGGGGFSGGGFGGGGTGSW